MSKHHLEGIPFLPPGTFNDSINVDFLQSMPIRLQRHWKRIDLEKYHEMLTSEEILAEEPTEPSSPDNCLSRVSRESEKEIDVLELSHERKAKAVKDIEEAKRKDPIQFKIEEELAKIRERKLSFSSLKDEGR